MGEFVLTPDVPLLTVAPHLDKGTPGESRGRKATGPRLLRDAALRPDATKDLKTAELRNIQLWRLCFFADQAFDRRDAQTSKQT